MRIAGIRAKFPSLKVSNQDVLQRTEIESRSTFIGDLRSTLKQVDLLLELSGSSYRYWVTEKSEHLELIRSTVREAVEESGIDPKAPGIVIHAGVDRVFAEPGDAYFVAKACDLSSAHCMDISDACNSFSRSVHVAQALLKQGLYPWVVVVNTECKMGRTLMDNKRYLKLNNREELAWKFASFTIGDCVAATVFLPSEEDIKFSIHSNPTLAHLCAVPNRRFSGYENLIKPEVLGLCDEYNLDPETIFEQGFFICFSKELETQGLRMGGKNLADLGIPMTGYDIVLPHTTSTGPWIQAAKAFNIQNKLFNIYSEVGNVVSASIPAGLFLAIQRGRIVPGSKVLCWTAAAGMSFFAYTFNY